MAGFRRCILAFATLVLGVLALGVAVPARAQLICNVSAPVTPTLRQEGLTEMVGDILLTCTAAKGAAPTPVGESIPQATFSVSVTASVTSRVLGGASPHFVTEALMLVDDPSPANQTPCLSPTNPAACEVAGDGGQTFNEPGKFNVFQGVTGGGLGTLGVTFQGIPVDPAAQGTRTYRIANLRINAPDAAVGLGLSPVYATVSASPSSSMTINNPQQGTTVGFVSPGVTITTASTNSTLYQCQTTAPTVVATATFAENFSTAFKVRTSGLQNLPAIIYFSESGLEINVSGGAAGTADTGTRFQTTITNIPSGVSIWVDNWASSPAAAPGFPSDATMVTGPGTPDDPGFDTITQITNGTQDVVTVVWEVTNTNPAALDSLVFNIYASFSADAPPTNVNGTGVSGLNPMLAVELGTGPIPQFLLPKVIPPVNLFGVSPCQAGANTISGKVTLSGNGLGGVAMTLSGSNSGSTATVPLGNYSFTETAGGSYTVTPSLNGYTFTPLSQTFQELAANQTANFVANLAGTTYTISGRATLYGSSLSGATITLSGSQSGAATTSESGSYSITVPTGSNYTVTASGTGTDYYFYPYPPSVTYSILSGNQTANFQAAVPSDFNHDGHPDVIWEEPTVGWAQIWYLGGAQGVTVTSAANVTKANPWTIVGVADFDGNGTPDIVWQDPVGGAVQVWYLGGPSGNELISALNITTSNAWRVASVADFNGDGHPDLLWEDPTSGWAQIWYLGGPEGVTLLGAANLTKSNPWRIVGTGDFNGDGTPDVLWQDPVSGTVQIWYMGGTTPGAQGSELISALNLTGPMTTKVVAIADFNQDGHPDVVFQNPTTGAAAVYYYDGVEGITPNGNAVLSTGNPWYIAGPH